MTTVIERTGVPVPRPGRFAALVVVSSPALREAVAYTLRALGARHVLEVSTVAEARVRAAAGVAATAVGGTVTRVVSESYGALAAKPATVELEVRASWTPLDDLGDHLVAWSVLLCTVGGLPPLPDGVAPLARKR